MNSMTIPDEAVEAAAWDNPTPCSLCDEGPARPCRACLTAAREMLTAALPYLHLTIPNTAEALEALPEGSVIQMVDTTLADTCVYTRWSYGWAGAGSYAVPTTSELVAYAEAELSLPGWIVLWPLGGAS